jgi:hypothetical protein
VGQLQGGNYASHSDLRNDALPSNMACSPAVLNLIKAHAILHQASRDRDDQGRIVATVDDYAIVRELDRCTR